MQWTRDNYVLTDDTAKVDLDAVFRLLSNTYWANQRPKSAMALSIQHSLCLSLWHANEQVGFCRAVTDHATFTWICDVIVDDRHQGRGLGKWMVDCLIHHPQIQTRQVLATRDAHTLYERFGFERAEFMRRPQPATEPKTP